MKIRNKILIYFSSTVIVLSAVSLSIIYILFSEYREEEFQQRQKEKVLKTIGLLATYREMSENLSGMMDKQTIHDFYDEKMLIFDRQKTLVYSSIDDLPIANYIQILTTLSPANRWIETKENGYDIIGMYVEDRQEHHYAISKAYDNSGYSKLSFLRNTLLVIFLATVIVVTVVSVFLSHKISKPISDLAEHLRHVNFEDSPATVAIQTSTGEIRNLVDKFNALLSRTNEAMVFQKHAVQHISHELKTPVAVLVSELERISRQDMPDGVRAELEQQTRKAESLGSIINVLLEISKIESGRKLQKQAVRVDELLFDIIDGLNSLYPEFHFEIRYTPDDPDENRLIIQTNRMLIRQAFQNLLANCIAYSSQPRAEVKIDGSSPRELKIFLVNQGEAISKGEEKYLFHHFFRGENSRGKTGFGLGLVLTRKIITLNSGTITYSNPEPDRNVFEIRFPLS
jgi:two-component system sensor histidine kinase ArlS